MHEKTKFFIDGCWVEPESKKWLDVINPATAKISGHIGNAQAADVHKAVAAARSAFPSFSATSVSDRVALLDRIIEIYRSRQAEMGDAIREEMGAPAWLADGFQTLLGIIQLEQARDAVKVFEADTSFGTSLLMHEPIGVCGFITPWNWPMNLVAAKVAPALAAGCTMVLKPSEVAPYSSYLFAEILEAAGVPKGVFNLVNGTGDETGAALSSHPEVDLISFTGSTRAGIEVARNAAPTIKRVLQELGGKSAHIILSDADLTTAVERNIDTLMTNSGQTCNAPTRMLVPSKLMQDAAEIAKAAVEKWDVGDPGGNSRMGPVAHSAQWNKIQSLIQAGIDEGAVLVTGGLGMPKGLSSGFYARPTVFTNVTSDMRIAKEEIFGPVLSIIAYQDDDEAIDIANNATDYGLAGYVSGTDQHRCQAIARKLRAGQVFVNDAENDFSMPFGGFKQSGNGREWGTYGLHEFFETKAIIGYDAKGM